MQIVVGIIGIGIGYAAKSEMNATRFGLPQLEEREARGWWQLKESATKFRVKASAIVLDYC